MDNKELRQFGSYLDRTCDGVTRRQMLKVGALGFLGLGLPEFLALEADAQTQAKKAGIKPKSKRDVSVIMLWMGGGPSHVDTWDPKPKAGTDIVGPFNALETNVPGIFIGENLPKMSRLMDKMAIIRSIRS